MGMRATPIDIAVSGLRAEARRMNVISANIANANTTRSEGGRPFRRQEVVLQTSGADGLAGVQVAEVADDLSTEFRKLYQPGHPDADTEGFVEMPNVQIPVEMMNMMGASRAYQANAAVLKRYMELGNTALELLR